MPVTVVKPLILLGWQGSGLLGNQHLLNSGNPGSPQNIPFAGGRGSSSSLRERLQCHLRTDEQNDQGMVVCAVLLANRSEVRNDHHSRVAFPGRSRFSHKAFAINTGYTW